MNSIYDRLNLDISALSNTIFSKKTSLFQLWILSNALLWPFVTTFLGYELRLNMILSLVIGALLVLKYNSSSYPFKILGCFLFFLFVSVIQLAVGICQTGLTKLLLSMPFFLALLFSGYLLSLSLRNNDFVKLKLTSAIVLLATFFGIIIEMCLPEYFPQTAVYRFNGQYSAFFPEPSALAFTVTPFIFLLFNGGSKLRIVSIFSIIFLCFFSLSSTFIMCILFGLTFSFFFIKKKQFLIILGLVLGVAVWLLPIFNQFLSPTFDRIYGILNYESSTNLSSLIYIQGLQDMWMNLQRSSGLGLGLNMMGCDPLPMSDSNQLVSRLFESQNMESFGLNAKDGSFLVAKIVSEFGFLGILFLLSCVLILKKTANEIQYQLNKIQKVHMLMLVSFFAVILFSFFIRSAGYFSGNFFNFIVIYFVFLRSKFFRG